MFVRKARLMFTKQFSTNQLRIKTLQLWELGWDSGRHDLEMLGLEMCPD